MHEDIHRTRGEALCHALEALVIAEGVVIVAEGEIVTGCPRNALVSRGGGASVWLVDSNDALVLGSQSVAEVARAIG